MRFGLTTKKGQNCYSIPLGETDHNRYFKYVEDIFDGSLYTYKNDDVDFDELINYFLNYRFCFIKSLFKTEAIDACISLLALPYFDELCQFVKENYHIIDKKHLFILRKTVFLLFANNEYHKEVLKWKFNFYDFYISHQCHEKSKEILLLIDSVLK